MKRKTQALYARHAAIKSHAATLAVHQAKGQVTRIEDRIAQDRARSEQEHTRFVQDLSRGTSAAHLALDLSNRLRHEHEARALQEQLARQLAELERARATQQQVRRQEKSARKMGERLDHERLVANRRAQQIEQDELVCHVIELAS